MTDDRQTQHCSISAAQLKIMTTLVAYHRNVSCCETIFTFFIIAAFGVSLWTVNNVFLMNFFTSAIVLTR